MRFLSERNFLLHKEYLRELSLKMSIFEKSYPVLSGKGIDEILKTKIQRQEREEAADLKAEILAHQIYFDSYGESGSICQGVKRIYGSEASFLYLLYEKCIDKSGFLFVFLDRDMKPNYCVGEDYRLMLQSCMPLLALDLCEHAYFLDYGFNKREYLQKALSHLNLSKLNI